MNILWFGKTGGANAWYHVTLTAVAHNVRNVYVVRHRRPLREIESDKIVFFETGASGNFLGSAMKLLKNAHRVMRRHSIDAIITFNVFPYGYLSYLLACIYRKRLILCFIGRDYYHYFHKQPYRSAIIRALRRADVVICKGHYMTEGLVRVGVEPSKIRYYPHFASNEFFIKTMHKPAFDIINICQFLAHKRVDVLVRALKVLKDQGVVLTACLLGEGPEKPKVIALADDLGVRSQITFPGFRDDVVSYLGRSRLFVQTSEREALSLSLVESIAAGLVPVCTTAGAEKDIIRHDVNGLFVTMGNHEDLAQALIYATKPEVYERLKQNVMMTRKDLTVERAASEMRDILQRLEVQPSDPVKIVL